MSEIKKIIYHFRVRGTGAEGVHIAGIVNGFRSLGHYVELVSPTGVDPTNQKPKLKEPTKDSFFTSVLHTMADILPQPLFELMEMAYNILAIPRLWIVARKLRPDFIYERYAFFSLSGAFIATILRIPLVVEVNEISGHKRVRGQFFMKLARLVEAYVFNHASLIITVSDFLKHEIQKMVSGNIRIDTIPNGVPRHWVESAPSEGSVETLRNELKLDNKKVICFIGGLVSWHNFEMLLEVVKSLQRDFEDLVLLIVGEGPLRGHIKYVANELDLAKDSVLLTGNVPHHEVPRYICLADVAIIPETNDYRSPIKMFEYMAMAKPVVAPRMPAIETVIEDGLDGMLFKPGDKDSFRDVLLRILGNPKKAHMLGQAARDKIKSHYTWEMNAQRILNLI